MTDCKILIDNKIIVSKLIMRRLLKFYKKMIQKEFTF